VVKRIRLLYCSLPTIAIAHARALTAASFGVIARASASALGPYPEAVIAALRPEGQVRVTSTVDIDLKAVSIPTSGYLEDRRVLVLKYGYLGCLNTRWSASLRSQLTLYKSTW
jgi:hypothetical protein